jgi:hypothetical protein
MPSWLALVPTRELELMAGGTMKVWDEAQRIGRLNLRPCDATLGCQYGK